MKFSYLRVLAILAMCLALPNAAQAQQYLNLRDADIRAVVQEVSRTTGRTFIVDPDVKGTISIMSEQPLSETEYFEAFLAALRANGYSAVPAAGIPGGFRVVSTKRAAGAGSTGANSLNVEVVQLGFVEADAAAQSLQAIVSAEGKVIASRAGNSLILVDYADNIRQLKSVLRKLDRDSRTTELVRLTNMSARDVAATLSAMQDEGAQGRVPVSVIPVTGSNALVLKGDAASVKRFVEISRQLDEDIRLGGDVRVIYLKHADADQVLPVLQQMVGQVVGAVGEGGAPAQAAPGRATIARFEGANALVVSAPPNLQRAITDIVEQLDRRREQVMVEALIVEISDGAARQLGVQFLFGGINGSAIPLAATNYSNTNPNLLTIAGAAAARELDQTTTTVDGGTVTTSTGSAARETLEQAAVASLLGTTGGLFGGGGQIGDDAIFAAVVNAIQSDNNSNMLSTPSIVTLDNQEAKILVGQEIPITTGEALADTFQNAFRTVERQNVGIQLEVRPQINKGGEITLFLRQEVSSIAGPVSDNFNDLILNKREVETTVTVDDGQIVALGGLLDEAERRSIERIPFLSDIPILGELFKSRARSGARTNLMIFIRPTILANKKDAAEVAGRRFDTLRTDMRRRVPTGDMSLEALARDYMGTDLPTLGNIKTPAEDE